MADSQPCDLVVYDLHGRLTSAVRREMRRAVSRSAAKIEIVNGVWRGRQVVVGWPRRLTASQLPPIREIVAALYAVHQPNKLVVIGPAAAGDTGLAPGGVVPLDDHPGLKAAWGEAARKVLNAVEAETVLLAAVTDAGDEAPRSLRPTAARATGRWIGALLRGSAREPSVDVSDAVADALAALLSGTPEAG